MKNSMRLAFAALLLAAMSLSPAFAQEPPPPFSPPKLTFSGNVQICESAEVGAVCKPAKPNETLPEGSHLMVGEGATAQLTYANGAVVNFTEPGLYTVGPGGGMLGAGTYVASSIVAANTGFITFAGLIAAAGVSSSAMGEDENLLVPLSGG